MKTLWLLGGLGLGAGLMYLMDPEKGAGRRDLVRGHLGDYGRQTGDLLDDTTRTLGRQAQAVLATTRVPVRRQPGLGERLRTQAEQFGMTTGLVLVGCVGLGAGLVYLLEPQGGPQRRALLREKARAYWQTTKTSHAPLPGTTGTARAVADTVAEPPPQADNADLQRMTGIGSKWAMLLKTAGVETVRELARRTPEHLHEKLRQVNEQEHVVDLLPSLEQVTAWIGQAKGEAM